MLNKKVYIPVLIALAATAGFLAFRSLRGEGKARIAPEEVVRTFYSAYVASIDASPLDPRYDQPGLVTEHFIESQRALRHNPDPDEIGLGYDPVSCAQDAPHADLKGVRISTTRQDATSARVAAAMNGYSYYPQFGLIKNGSSWTIDSIECVLSEDF